MNCTIYVARTEALISFAVTVKLISVFVFSHMQNVGFLMTQMFIGSFVLITFAFNDYMHHWLF